MTIAMDKLCRVFSRGLDIIEQEQVGASECHSRRICALSTAAGKMLGFDDDTLSTLAVSALFHDNALTEYHLAEEDGTDSERNMILHCEKGQSNVSWLPFKKNIEGIILYHHERADGSGPFGKKEGEFPLEAAILSAADFIDVTNHLQRIPAEGLSALRDKIASYSGTCFTRAAADALLEVLDYEMLESLRDENILQTLDNIIPSWAMPVTESSVTGIASFFAHVIDYKSPFTRKHTNQIANRAWLMSKHYGYNQEERAALYLAASLHDVGKIATPSAVLEKPGKLDHDEFETIKKHVRYTHDWLSEIPNFEKIKEWAANHHEKLDGKGYSFGKDSGVLDKNSRLLACIDIYQAVCEERPYHAARSHADTIPILYDMANKGFIDLQLVKDLDEVMAEYSLKDLPSPE